MQKTVQKGYNVNAESAPEVKRQRTIGPPVPVKLLIEDVNLNGEVAEKLKVSLRVFDYELPIAEATTVNMRAVEKLCAKQIHPLMLDNDIFSDVLSLADQLGCRRRLHDE
jgi:hypothetical protein